MNYFRFFLLILLYLCKQFNRSITTRIIETLESSPIIKLPEPSLRRLPWYLAYIKLLQAKGEEYVSSTQIAKEIGVDSSKIAKDLSFLNISGKTRVGYEIDSLVAVLEEFLGFTSIHKAFIFGVGNLGAALMHDSGLSQYGLEVVAGFDVNPQLIGTTINHIPIFSIEQFAQKRQEMGVQVGILAVPVDKAQQATNEMIAGGIKAIWNFTPYRIRAPKNIVIQNTSIYAHLAVMFNRLNNIK